MNDRLESGTNMQTASGLSVVIDEFLGAGGQGEVYRVKSPEGDRALKYYFSHTSTARQRENLHQLVDIGFDDTRFLWPLDTLQSHDARRFGYLMQLRPPGWATIPDLLARRVSGATIRTLYRVGINLASAFRSLHARGMAYRDISWGNVFFHPATGRILVCDNDNAMFGGAESGIRGTPKFMAPEVVRGEADPSAETDLHSLAVLLFMVFVNGHPLDGAREAAEMCMDEAAEAKLYGDSPLFLFDPDDRSNKPLPGIHDTVITLWPTLPLELKELFSRSFTSGLSSPSQRVTEGEWVKNLSRMHDRIFRCGGCGKTNVFDKRQHERTGVAGNCWSCHKPPLKPPMLLFGRRELVLEPDVKLYRHHLSESVDPDYSEPIAELIAHPSKPGRFGLKNLTESTWSKLEADGRTAGVGPGKAARISSALKLDIDGVRFTIG
jgi:DNA-binding helix-hairpin-helix protein with protein kinase domain